MESKPKDIVPPKLKMNCSKTLAVLLLLCSLCHVARAKDINVSLTEAVRQDLVSISGVASGNPFNEKGLALRIENKSKKTINITIDPALIFTPADSVNYQSLLVAGDITVSVVAAGSQNIVLQSYCGNSEAFVPGKDLKYRLKGQADSTVIKTLAYIKKHNIQVEIAQKAVWVLTNQKPLNTIYAPSDDLTSRNLTQYMAVLLKKGAPAYFKYFELNREPHQPGSAVEPIVPAKPLRIYALLKWELKTASALTLAVYDDKGTLQQTLFDNQSFKAGGYELNTKFESAELPSGNYYIRLSAAAGILKEIPVAVD
jgi:hypothetical protein